jgi:hypothetical protein
MEDKKEGTVAKQVVIEGEGTKNKHLLLIGLGAAAVIAIILLLTISFPGGSSPEQDQLAELTTNYTDLKADFITAQGIIAGHTGKIADLQSALDDISDWGGPISGLQHFVSLLSGNITELSNRLTALESNNWTADILALQGRVDDLEDALVACNCTG